MKFFYFIFIVYFFLPMGVGYGFGPVEIYSSDFESVYDLSGRNGFPGRDGADAYPADCSDGQTRQGRSGEDGNDGEPGENGRDALVYYDDLSELSKLIIDQSGGRGGAPGRGGEGAPGCHGGEHGESGEDGVYGKNGTYGRLFLIPNHQSLEKANTTSVVTLAELVREGLSLGENIWSSRQGAKKLFHPRSRIRDQYYIYKDRITYQVKVVWSASSSYTKFHDTKLALSVKDGQLRVISYRGAIIDYRVKKRGETFYFEVFNVIDELEVKNLYLAKLRAQGEDLTLEVKERFIPNFKVETTFVISLNSQGQTIGSFPIDQDLIEKRGKTFYLNIGKLNFPSHLKKHGTRLTINLSIYRKAKEQTRVLSLRGVYRI
ncbi:MAG: hypothetical protein QF441_05995 [Bacteriovoracaceae bacterium]|nr:hypothetical protein [Halobacteriovoraceae bacterium]MDP7320140.1 hypothetical protein [Bacteriovoracaceae bacterium]